LYYSPEIDGPMRFEGKTENTLALCHGHSKVQSYSQISLPFSANVTFQEIQTMGIDMRYVTEGSTRRIPIPSTVPMPEHLQSLLPEESRK